MKSKNPFIGNLLLFAGALILFGIFMACIVYFSSFTSQETRKSTCELITDSPRYDEKELNKLLKAMEFPEYEEIRAENKLKLAELNEYSDQMYLLKVKAEKEAFELREIYDSKILEEKELNLTKKSNSYYERKRERVDAAYRKSLRRIDSDFRKKIEAKRKSLCFRTK